MRGGMAFRLPELGYEYTALEPHIDAQTMAIHHTKHHNTYVAGLNAGELTAPSPPYSHLPAPQLRPLLRCRSATDNAGGARREQLWRKTHHSRASVSMASLRM